VSATAPPRATCRLTMAGPRYLVRWSTADKDLWPTILADFRTTVPRHRDRTGCRVEGCWSVPRTWFPGGAVSMEEPDASEVDEEEEPTGDGQRLPAASDTLTRAYACLHLLPTAPPELVRLAHRYAARTHHPDRGGNTSGMAAINAARETIRAHQERR